MVGDCTLKWCLAFLWVGLPMVGWLPGVPVRLSTQWLSVLASLVVIGVSKQGVRNPFRWLILSCVILAILHYHQPNSAYLWAVQATLLLTSASLLVGSAKPLQTALIVCAWVQVLVMSCQWFNVSMPFAQHYPKELSGTMGSIRPVSILIGLAALWSTGSHAWVLSALACLTGSGTVVPIIALRRWWPYRHRPLGWMAGTAFLMVGAKWCQQWLFALSERAAIWSTWTINLWGIGFRAFPGGFRDDTALGKAMHWQDAHNTLLDWVGRFGLPGLVVLLGMFIWMIRRKPDPWTALFVLWVACCQSVEQFPVLIVLWLVWLIVLCEGEKNAVDSV